MSADGLPEVEVEETGPMMEEDALSVLLTVKLKSAQSPRTRRADKMMEAQPESPMTTPEVVTVAELLAEVATEMTEAVADATDGGRHLERSGGD